MERKESRGEKRKTTRGMVCDNSGEERNKKREPGALRRELLCNLLFVLLGRDFVET